MKYVLASFVLVYTLTAQANCEIQSDCKWQNLDDSGTSLENQQTFGGKWILAATITFKKRTPDDIYFTMLDLEWQGISLSKLNATLFRCDPDRPFVPLEENVIADGSWSEHHQMLRFAFKEKERLQTTHTFGLVLTIPAELEKTIKTGHFNLVPATLPKPLQAIAQENPLHVHFMRTTKDTVIS